MARPPLVSLALLCLAPLCSLGLTPDEVAKLPAPAARTVEFTRDIQPLFESSCIKCHARGKAKGGLSLESRAQFLKGGDTGAAAIPGASADSLIVEYVSGIDPDNIMPKKGKRWTAEDVGLLRAWIDQGAAWPESVNFARPPARNLEARAVALPNGLAANPIDRLLEATPEGRRLAGIIVVDDARFARRAALDVIGLFPTVAELDDLAAAPSPGKRESYVARLLADDRDYAANWLTFWNDLLRNDYTGAGFIDGGRKQISEWLYDALLNDEPYDRFVADLVAPSGQTEGFTAGIRWRGNVTAAMLPPMQAAQSVSQVFLGINLKCASCHDSFVSDWSLEDAYGMAAVYGEGPLELVHCDKPTGQQAAVRFLYPQLGRLDPEAARADRLRAFAALMTKPENGRLARTIVNRLWGRFFGRALVEPVDDLEQPAWNPDLLDWLANDLVAHGYDLKRTIGLILTSRAYQLPCVEAPGPNEPYVFRGPLVRRLNAEQYADAWSTVTGDWASLPSSLEFDLSGGAPNAFLMPAWIWTDEKMSAAARRMAARRLDNSANAVGRLARQAEELSEEDSPAAEAALRAAQAAAEEAARAAQSGAAAAGEPRHKVVFRKRLELAAKPDIAYATVLATQSFEVRVNDRLIKPAMTDDLYNGRVRLFNFAPALRVGENVIAIGVESHTEKAMTDLERAKYPASAQHLNRASGLAFYLRCRQGGEAVEFVSDASWRARRAPGGDWADPAMRDDAWLPVVAMPGDFAPVDEGPGLEPIGRKDFANIPVPLAPPLRAAVSTAALAGKMRAAFRSADPLQTALDRPNREIVITVRQNAATPLQSLELTNGETLNAKLAAAAGRLAQEATPDPAVWLERAYRSTLARRPTVSEKALILPMLGSPVRPEGVADFLWALGMLPEFQFIN